MRTPHEGSWNSPDARLAALAVYAAANGFEIERPGPGRLRVRLPGDDHCVCGADRADVITCRPHAGDDQRLWYFTSWGLAITEADRVIDAAVIIRGYLTPGPEQWR
jgi:hypothetical protein